MLTEKILAENENYARLKYVAKELYNCIYSLKESPCSQKKEDLELINLLLKRFKELWKEYQ
jgi:hypothetical protein